MTIQEIRDYHYSMGPTPRNQDELALAYIRNKLRPVDDIYNVIPLLSNHYSLIIIMKLAHQNLNNWIDETGFNGNREKVDAFTLSRLIWSYTFFNRREDLNAEIKRNGFEVGSKYIDFIANTFPGNLVNQTRLFNLLVIYLPRAQNKYVSINNKLWKRIAGNGYPIFQQTLIEKDLLDIDNDYHIGFHSKQAYLKVVGSMPLNLERKQVNNYHEFLQILPKSYLKNELDLNKMTIHRLGI